MRLGELLILAALWMLFGFMLWYYLAVFHGIPARWLAEQGLSTVLGEDFYNIIANPDKRYLYQVQTRIPFSFPDGSTGPLGFIVNPLVYGYGLPLLFGLIMATGQKLRHKLAVLAIGWGVIVAVQAWGVFWESLKTMAFTFGGPAREAVMAAGFSEGVIALCYQLGALILPALAPVMVWVLGSRSEIERFIRPDSSG